MLLRVVVLQTLALTARRLVRQTSAAQVMFRYMESIMTGVYVSDLEATTDLDSYFTFNVPLSLGTGTTKTHPNMQLIISMVRAQGTKQTVWNLPWNVTPEPSSMVTNTDSRPIRTAIMTVTKNANRQVCLTCLLRNTVPQPARLTYPHPLQFPEPAKEHTMLCRNG